MTAFSQNRTLGRKRQARRDAPIKLGMRSSTWGLECWPSAFAIPGRTLFQELDMHLAGC